jgi:hypothetical protein
MFKRLGRVINRHTFGPLRCALALGILLAPAVALEARGQTTDGPITLERLLQMSPSEIEAVYRQGRATAIPEGPIRGTALLSPGTRRARILSRGARLFWQGKVFEPGRNAAVNRFFGMRIIRGQVFEGPSWLDGQPSLVLDYSQTSRVYANNRDEIREIAPGLFLGLMYDRTTAPPGLQMYFALQSRL